jgi:UDP-N-acetylmuramoylalanine--D-glutamate ligase
VNDRFAPSQDWTGAHAGVLGLGRSGIGAVRLLHRAGAIARAFDDRPAAALPSELRDELAALGVDVLPASERCDEALADLSLVVVSPGVASSHPLLLAAARAGIPTIGELELACRRTRADVVAVTGTNGKSTTVSIVHAMFERAGVPTLLAGNIGTALSDEVERIGRGGWLVVEASSFQLERIEHFHPRAAAVLNLAPDHLDRYADFEAYAAAKRNLLRNLDGDDTFVHPADDERLTGWARACPARRGAFALQAHDDALAWIEDEHFVRRIGTGIERVLPVGELPLVGVHNRANTLAAIALGTACELDAAAMATALRGFAPLPHRAVIVPSDDGLTWIDDSKATNVHAAAATLSGLGAPVVALLGGRGKGEDYAPLRAFAHGMRAALCYGEEGGAIARVLEGSTWVERHGGMRDALLRAASIAQTGDVVLLSPACASYDEFRNFEHRGEVFAAWVAEHRGGGA